MYNRPNYPSLLIGDTGSRSVLQGPEDRRRERSDLHVGLVPAQTPPEDLRRSLKTLSRKGDRHSCDRRRIPRHEDRDRDINVRCQLHQPSVAAATATMQCAARPTAAHRPSTANRQPATAAVTQRHWIRPASVPSSGRPSAPTSRS